MNLTTYSRKPKNYNGPIIFEIDIMKKSTPINLNLCQTWLFKKLFGCFFFFLTFSEGELRVLWVQQKRQSFNDKIFAWNNLALLPWVPKWNISYKYHEKTRAHKTYNSTWWMFSPHDAVPTVEFELCIFLQAFNAISEWEYVKKESMCIFFLISMICILENVSFIHF